MIATTILFVCLLALSSASATNVPVTYCDTEISSLISGLSIDLTESTDSSGDRYLHATVAGTLKQDIDDGSFSFTAYYDGFPLIDQSGHICELLACPLKAGYLSQTKITKLPALAPAGDYEVKVYVYDAKSSEQGCIDAKYTLETAVVDSSLGKDLVLQSCASSYTSIVANAEISVSPYPLAKGKLESMKIHGELSSDILAGSQYSFTLSIDGFPLITKSGDIAEFLKKTYPIKSGPFSFLEALKLPSYAPSGSYHGEIRFHDASQTELACLSLDYDLEDSASKQFQVQIRDHSRVSDVTSALSDDIIETVNAAEHAAWTARRNTRFEKLSIAQVKNMCGARKSEKKLPTKSASNLDFASLPIEFDARKHWGHLCPTLYEVRDQGNCGSCWAFGAAEVMSDRICIASSGEKQVVISAEDLVSCCYECGDGCNGGEPSAAFEYWVDSGVVSGGAYHSGQGCLPYEVAPCEHHVSKTSRPACSGDMQTPSCTQNCINGQDWTSQKHFGASAYSLGSVEEIMKEVYTNGPVEVAFDVYQDFVTYSSGVYEHVTGEYMGGHAVKLVGWGVDSDSAMPYWLIANSWNYDWGLAGYFKIRRGTDECGIESDVVAGLPQRS